jgi:hypothetical protein
MKSTLAWLGLSASVALALTPAAQAQIIIYDNLGTAAQGGYSSLNSTTPTFGDSLTLSQGGTLTRLGLTLFNSTSGGNTGAILAGDMVVNFYDNTVPYTSGPITNPLLGTADLGWDFGDTGLAVGFYSAETFDISSLGITVPQNILITQTFTQTEGTSLRHGLVLFGNPVVGNSPNTIFLSSTANAAGLYTVGTTAGQVGYRLEIPEPSAAALLGLGLLGGWLVRRRETV